VITEAIQVTIEIRDFDFSPRELSVPAGAVVTWLNSDGVPHDATEDGLQWWTGLLNQGDSDALKFEFTAVYSYYCSIHPTMKATLTVA
jgi:plastocyanin